MWGLVRDVHTLDALLRFKQAATHFLAKHWPAFAALLDSVLLPATTERDAALILPLICWPAQGDIPQAQRASVALVRTAWCLHALLVLPNQVLGAFRLHALVLHAM